MRGVAPPPALFTMTSSRPNAPTVSAISPSTWSGTVMSQPTAMAVPPADSISPTTPSRFSFLRDATTTLAPASA